MEEGKNAKQLVYMLNDGEQNCQGYFQVSISVLEYSSPLQFDMNLGFRKSANPKQFIDKNHLTRTRCQTDREGSRRSSIQKIKQQIAQQQIKVLTDQGLENQRKLDSIKSQYQKIINLSSQAIAYKESSFCQINCLYAQNFHLIEKNIELRKQIIENQEKFVKFIKQSSRKQTNKLLQTTKLLQKLINSLQAERRLQQLVDLVQFQERRIVNVIGNCSDEEVGVISMNRGTLKLNLTQTIEEIKRLIKDIKDIKNSIPDNQNCIMKITQKEIQLSQKRQQLYRQQSFLKLRLELEVITKLNQQKDAQIQKHLVENFHLCVQMQELKQKYKILNQKEQSNKGKFQIHENIHDRSGKINHQEQSQPTNQIYTDTHFLTNQIQSLKNQIKGLNTSLEDCRFQLQKLKKCYPEERQTKQVQLVPQNQKKRPQSQLKNRRTNDKKVLLEEIAFQNFVNRTNEKRRFNITARPSCQGASSKQNTKCQYPSPLKFMANFKVQRPNRVEIRSNLFDGDDMDLLNDSFISKFKR